MLTYIMAFVLYEFGNNSIYINSANMDMVNSIVIIEGRNFRIF
jgi:hypothetical protein